MRRQVTIEFTSDWQCGSGTGVPGGVDRQIIRDQDGLPYVPARTARGIWRYGCELAAEAFDEGLDTRPWAGLVALIFGAATNTDSAAAGGLLQVDPARLAPEWISRLRDPRRGATREQRLARQERTLLRDALVVPRFNTRIDPERGTAHDDTLRLNERARAGLTLHAGYSWPTSKMPWQVELLLAAGAALVHHVGGTRRRGAGRCTMRLDGLDVTALLTSYGAQLGDFDLNDLTLGTLDTTHVTTTGAARPDSGRHTRRFDVTLTATLPLVITRHVIGNTVESLDYVPASMLLPIVARALGPEAADLIREARIVVTDATPVIARQRSVRTALSLVAPDKGRQLTESRDVILAGDDIEGAKPIGGWSVGTGPRYRVATTRLVTRAHPQIDDAEQRPLANSLFAYEAIPAGSILRCQLWADENVRDQALKGIKELNNKTVRIGRSKTADYAAARLSVAAPEQAETQEAMVTSFILTLESDTVLIDDVGNPTPTVDALVGWLSERIDVGLRLRDSRSAVVRRESWNRGHGLPRRSVIGLAAGSVVRIDVAGEPVNLSRLQEILARGIGELRVEGYGRCRVGEVKESEQQLDVQVSSIDTATSSEAAAEPSDAAWTRFVALAWHDELLKRIRAMASDGDTRKRLISSKVSSSQLGSLRTAARNLTRDDQAVARWVHATRFHPAREKAWGAERLKLLEDLATPLGRAGPRIQWPDRVHRFLADPTRPELPSGLLESALPTQLVASAIVLEFVRQQGIASKRTDALS